MPIDFHSEKNRTSYSSREASPTWVAKMQDLLPHLQGQHVLDIGCGGGIYCKAFVDMGAGRVTGVDFSEEILKGARENCEPYEQIDFVAGNALDTGLPSGQYDVILERALTHHLQKDQLPACFEEASRLLKPGGVLLIQNRTPEDCLLPGSRTHMRGYFFERYPKLSDKEVSRRHSSPTIQEALQGAGFSQVDEHTLWETRRVYGDSKELSQDLLSRTGRSILHELSDEELADLTAFIEEKMSLQAGEEIEEQDRWTIWVARKK